VGCGWALGATEAVLASISPALITPPAALVVPPLFEPHPEPQPENTGEPQQAVLLRLSDALHGSSAADSLLPPGPPPGLALPQRPASMPATPIGGVGMFHLADSWHELPPLPASPLFLSPVLPPASADRVSPNGRRGAAIASPAAAGALPSLGSASHAQRKCKPCAFVHKSGCESGFDCKFCHLCLPGEKKMRKQERKERGRAAKQRLAMEQVAGLSSMVAQQD